MKRFFTLILGALAMVAVALISAFIAMRLAIHGREVDVPRLAGLSVSDASALARREGLNLVLENRFYASDVPAGRVLAQDPPPGSRVRRAWAIRITESLGPQRVSIPDLTGQSERAASVTIRRLSLDPGVVAHLAVPGDPDVVLTQTPPADSAGVDGPRVSLVVSDPEAADAPAAYVMPSLVGMTYAAAAARAATAGLHLVAAPDAPAPAAESPDISAMPAPQTVPAPQTRPTGVVIGQFPQAGHRVVRGEAIHVTLDHSAPGPTDTTSAP